MLVYTQDGIPLTLDQPALGKGKEGRVFTIKGYPRKVAKIYLDEELARSRREKIEAMREISTSPLFVRKGIAEKVAWPLGLLFSDAHARRFVGFGMNAAYGAMTFDDLYAYPTPKDTPALSIPAKLLLLISLADILEDLHDIGQVVGDLNEGNIGLRHVSSRGGYQAFLLDADSMHLSAPSKLFRCTVCLRSCAAPELTLKLKGHTYETYPGQTFTPETDNFALAVHVFRMLFNGAHPFSCVPRAQSSAPQPMLSLGKRMEMGHTPFFKRVPGFQAPVYAPASSMLPPYLEVLFRRAFVEGAKQPATRPRPAEWRDALVRYGVDIVPCASDMDHWHWRELGECPYCAAEEKLAGSIGMTSCARRGAA